MAQHPKVCYERLLPQDFNAPLLELRSPAGTRGGPPSRAALVIKKRWPIGTTLHVRYIGGTADQKKTVERFAKEWFEIANLDVSFGTRPDAQIRIAFADDGAWSYIGADCLGIPRDQPTMNFGWLDQGVVLHEFGHALGLIHEHQSPNVGIQWNREAVIAALSGAPNYWDLATIEHNMFEKYQASQMNSTEFDSKSIMLYSFPEAWTIDGFHSEPNEVLSDSDKSFIASDGAYAGRTGGSTQVVELSVGRVPVTSATIEKPGQQRLFKFRADERARYRIETESQQDLVMALYGPEDATRLVAEDDDSGFGSNPCISADLTPGTYFVQVRPFNATGGTGDYRIYVMR